MHVYIYTYIYIYVYIYMYIYIYICMYVSAVCLKMYWNGDAIFISFYLDRSIIILIQTFPVLLDAA